MPSPVVRKSPPMVPRQPSSQRRQVVAITRGTDPEVQEVSISPRGKKDDDLVEATMWDEPSHCKSNGSTGGLRRRSHRGSKSMTTRSTMTNDDDYTVVHTNTPCTTPPLSTHGVDHDDHDEDRTHMDVKDGWKIPSHRVHFPPPNTLNGSSQRTFRIRVPRFGKPANETRKVEPTFVHRPDRTLIVHQDKPTPMEPIRAWPGYGGNVYFQPFRIDAKPIGDRMYSSKSAGTARPRSEVNRSPELSEVDYDYTIPESAGKRATSSNAMTLLRKRSAKHPEGRTPQSVIKFECGERRQMSRLDKHFVYSLSRDHHREEDRCWISGGDALGSLKIGNPASHVQRQSTNETFTRHTIVQKVPRSFVFHTEHLQADRNPAGSLGSLRKHFPRRHPPQWAVNC